MKHLEYFYESTGGAQLVDKTDDYSAYFITSFEGMQNMEINDPRWCTRSLIGFGSHLYGGFSFLRYKFKSDLKLRFTISKDGIYSFSIVGYPKNGDIIHMEYHFPHYTVYSNNISYEKFRQIILEKTTKNKEKIDYVLGFIEKIDYDKLNKLIRRIGEKNWNSLISRKTDKVDLYAPRKFTYKSDDIEFDIVKVSDLDNRVECYLEYDQNLNGIFDSWKIISKENGHIPITYFTHNLAHNIRLTVLLIKFSGFVIPESKHDELVDKMKSIKLFKNVYKTKYGIKCEFKNFVLKILNYG
jgi:hypothetical protein